MSRIHSLVRAAAATAISLLLVALAGCESSPTQRSEDVTRLLDSGPLFSHLDDYSDAAGAIEDAGKVAALLFKIRLAWTALEGLGAPETLLEKVAPYGLAAALVKIVRELDVVKDFNALVKGMRGFPRRLRDAAARVRSEASEDALRALAATANDGKANLERIYRAVAKLADWTEQLDQAWRRANGRLVACELLKDGMQEAACRLVRKASEPLEELLSQRGLATIRAAREQLAGDVGVLERVVALSARP